MRLKIRVQNVIKLIKIRRLEKAGRSTQGNSFKSHNTDWQRLT